MHVLITGGLGYLGGRLAQFLAVDSEYRLVLASRKPNAAAPWLPPAEIVTTSWESNESLERACEGVSAVVHLAGMNAPDSAADPTGAFESNAVATGRLLQAAVRQGVQRFIYLSTAHVYDAPLNGTISESDCLRGNHPYATSHRAGEDLVRAISGKGDLQGVVIRLSNAYGAPAHKDANCWMLLVDDICRQAVTTKRIVLRSSPLQRRDFVTITDACRAIRHLMELPSDRLGDGLFNVGGNWSATLMEMTERVAARAQALTDFPIEIEHPPILENAIPDNLDYRIDKILSTGFALDPAANIDHEIDGVIRFCLANFSRS
jgi:UDP-glucose 4-epimerase